MNNTVLRGEHFKLIREREKMKNLKNMNKLPRIEYFIY